MNININKVKIMVTVPIESTKKIRKAMCEANAGIIGNYSYCTSCIKCLGTFKPNANAKPYTGKKDEINFVEEEILEVVCDISNVKNTLKTIRKIHPYEEPAIDIIPLLDEEYFK